MTDLMKRTLAAITIFSLATIGLMLSGCGSSDGGLSSQTVNGTAAVGAPLAGQVSLKDSSSTPQTRTTVIAGDGTFAIDVTGMQAPFILQATGSASGTSYKLHSFAEGTGIANINPLSDAIVAGAAGDDDASKTYDNADHDKLNKIKGNLAATVDALLKKLQPLLQHYNAQNTNPITSRYIANHMDLDDMFDNVKITVANGVLSIINTKTGAVIYSGTVTDIANGNFYPGNVPSTPTIPTAPTGVAAVGGAGQVTVSWTAAGNATSYNIYYATTSGVTTATGTKIANAATPYTQSGLTAGTTYYYVVTAVNSGGESVASAQVSATTNAAVPTPTAPAAPSGVAATGGTKQVTISWPAVSGATSYNIYYATASGVTTASGTKITNAASPAVQTGLSDATTYYYVVTAVNNVGESAASVQVAATTLAAVPAPTAPVAPTGVSATGGTNQVTVSWSAASGATSYNLYYSTTTGVTTANGTKIAGATSPYVQTGLAAGTTYYFIVTAVNSVGESAASAQASVATSAAAIDGAALYTQYCAGCHGALGSSAYQGASAALITTGIANISSMKKFGATGSTPLSAAQIAAIAAALL